MRIVIIGGLPASGKSTLANRLSRRLPWPFLAKDNYKELLFDSLHAADRAWSRRLSAAAYRLMFQHAEELLRCRIGCILEGNFREREHDASFLRLREAGADFVQVHCRAQPEILIARFNERANTGSRHAGHADLESLAEIKQELRTARQAPLPIAGELIECDTSGDWSAAIDEAVERTVRVIAA